MVNLFPSVYTIWRSGIREAKMNKLILILAVLILGLSAIQADAARKPSSSPGSAKALSRLNAIRLRSPAAAQKGLCTAITAISAHVAGVKPDVPASAGDCVRSEAPGDDVGDTPGDDVTDTPGDDVADTPGDVEMCNGEPCSDSTLSFQSEALITAIQDSKESARQAAKQAREEARETAQSAREEANAGLGQAKAAREAAAEARGAAKEAQEAARDAAKAARKNQSAEGV